MIAAGRRSAARCCRCVRWFIIIIYLFLLLGLLFYLRPSLCGYFCVMQHMRIAHPQCPIKRLLEFISYETFRNLADELPVPFQYCGGFFLYLFIEIAKPTSGECRLRFKGLQFREHACHFVIRPLTGVLGRTTSRSNTLSDGRYLGL